jgi:glycosyltransferase involved in cell wall biosynthesis
VLVYLPSVASMLGAEPGTPAGGAEVQMPLLAKGLARVGSRVCMVAFDESGSVPDSVAGVDIVRRPPYQARRGPWGKLAEAWAIRASVAAADADTVLTRSAVPTTGLLALAAKLQRRRFVYSSASDADFEMERVEHKRRNIALFHLGIRLADIVVVQNERQRGLCENRFRRTPVVIKSIAEPAEMRASEPEAFLWAGRIVSYKQPLAFLELARHVPEAKFWMVGIPEPGADRQQLLAEVRRLSAELPNLELLDPLPRGELMSLVERSVAIVNTSEYEGLSNTFLEAWARGVPALSLAHDPDGLLERLELGAFAGGSAGRLATLARSLWEGRHRQQELAERCRRYVRHEHAPESIYRQWRAALGLGVQESVSEPLLAGAV